MKKVLLSIGFLILLFPGFSQNICPADFTRNNGNDGSCGAQIRLYFAECPTSIPTLDSIKINGVLQPQTFTIIGQTCHGNNNHVDYCAGDNNLPPAGRITVYLTYPGNGTPSNPRRSVACNITQEGPLPIIISEFNAQRGKNNDVNVIWKTDQEINSSHFEIERAYDKESFEKIGTILAAGNSNIIKSYSFIDRANNSKKSSIYRLKMIDKDGSFSYSELKSVKGSDAVKSGFVIYPNPGYANSKITIGNLEGPAIIKLFDLSGRTVKTISLQNYYTADINDLQKGTYFVQITEKNSGITQVKKLSIIN